LLHARFKVAATEVQARFQAVESKYLNKSEKQKQINKHVDQKAHSLEARRSNSDWVNKLHPL